MPLAPYWLSAPALASPPGGLRGFRNIAWCVLVEAKYTVLSCPSPRVQSVTRTLWPSHRLPKQPVPVPSFPEVFRPSTHSETGSDHHRVCLTRLSCAFRFSQPLDALFHPQPLRPCLMPVTPLGFRFQRVSPPGSHGSGDPLAPLAVSPGSFRRHPSAEAFASRLLYRGPRLQGFAHPGDPYRSSAVLSAASRPILS